ncbi:hypothetical protein [Streptomyces sp. NPDC001880]
MSGLCAETVEQQAYLTRFLLDYTAVPLAGGTFLRGVLPTRDAVRVVTGAADAVAPDALVAYEVPLVDDDGEPVTAPLVLGWTRTLAADGPAHPDASVMGMALVRADTSVVEPAPRVWAIRAATSIGRASGPTVDGGYRRRGAHSATVSPARRSASSPSCCSATTPASAGPAAM